MSEPIVDQASIAEVVKQVSDAMSGAMKQYGPDAVDLAVMAYRVDAVQQIVEGVVLAIIAVLIVKAFLWVWAVTGKGIEENPRDTEGYYVARVGAGIVGATAGGLTGAQALANLMDVAAWTAVAGYPELRIAMKALSAAGLM